VVIYGNAEGVHGQSKFGNPCFKGLNQWSSKWAKSPSRNDFMYRGGDLVIYEIWWGGFSFQGGDFCRLKHTNILN